MRFWFAMILMVLEVMVSAQVRKPKPQFGGEKIKPDTIIYGSNGVMYPIRARMDDSAVAARLMKLQADEDKRHIKDFIYYKYNKTSDSLFVEFLYMSGFRVDIEEYRRLRNRNSIRR